ncbi:hypothetical protein DFH09DRAFT_1089259 [Mycena vulgaris]|nr:hypothetical protein DFH09DRAFT_1089259 [Mycena vulgaris]
MCSDEYTVGLGRLPCLTHLAFHPDEDDDPAPTFQGEQIWIRASGTNRKIFIDYEDSVIAKGDAVANSSRDKDGRINYTEKSRCFGDDPRSVLVGVSDYLNDWEVGAKGGTDHWPSVRFYVYLNPFPHFWQESSVGFATDSEQSGFTRFGPSWDSARATVISKRPAANVKTRAIFTPDEHPKKRTKTASTGGTKPESPAASAPDAPCPGSSIYTRWSSPSSPKSICPRVIPSRSSLLHEAILKYQAKPDFTAQILIPETPFAKSGRPSSAAIEDPMEGLPFDIAIADLNGVEALKFSKVEPAGMPSAPGPGRCTQLAESHCGIQSASGVFRMKHAWMSRDAGGKDVVIFEGYLSFNLVNSEMYRRKGQESGDKVDFAFWGGRARRNAAGQEIGLTENN